MILPNIAYCADTHLLVAPLLLGRRLLDLLGGSVALGRLRRRLGLLRARLLWTLVRAGRAVPLAARHLTERNGCLSNCQQSLKAETGRGLHISLVRLTVKSER